MREKIISVIVGIDEDADIGAMLAAPHLRLSDTLWFDSLDHLSLCLDLENEFGIDIEDGEYHELASLATIEAMLRRKGVAG